MTTVNSPHDRFFKAAMADVRVAREFLENYLPGNVRQIVDLDCIELQHNSYVDTSLQLTSSDVLYKTNIAGKSGFLYVLCEHQSSVDPLMPFRLVQYMVGIWADHLKQDIVKEEFKKSQKLPLIIPIVFYHGSKLYDGCRDIREMIDAPVDLVKNLFHSFQLIDVGTISDEVLRSQVWLGVLGFMMKHIHDREILGVLNPLIEMIHRLRQRPGSSDFIDLSFNYLLNAGETVQVGVLLEKVIDELSEPLRGNIMTIADQLIKKGQDIGLELGIKKGEELGIKKGEAILLAKLLTKKFGTLFSEHENLIFQASSEQLLLWCDKALEVTRIEDLFIEK